MTGCLPFLGEPCRGSPQPPSLCSHKTFHSLIDTRDSSDPPSSFSSKTEYLRKSLCLLHLEVQNEAPLSGLAPGIQRTKSEAHGLGATHPSGRVVWGATWRWPHAIEYFS